MKRLMCVLLLFVAMAAMADERGEERLGRISRHYSALGNYSLTFVLSVGENEQRGELAVDGNNSYMQIADTEVFVKDSLRYEVRQATKEIIVDRADAYEKELLNPLNGFASVVSEYRVEECELDGKVALRLTPKRAGEVVYIVIGVDGESITRVKYGEGAAAAELQVIATNRAPKSLPKFNKECYKGFELIDFR